MKQAKPILVAVLIVGAIGLGIAWILDYTDDVEFENASEAERDFSFLWISDYWANWGTVEHCSQELSVGATVKCDPITEYEIPRYKQGHTVKVTHVAARWWEGIGDNRTLYEVRCPVYNLERLIVTEGGGKCESSSGSQDVSWTRIGTVEEIIEQG